MSLAGLIDPAAEAKRLEKQMAEKRKHLAAITAKLSNTGFVARRPPEVVQQQRELAEEVQKQIRIIEETFAT